MGRSSGWMLMSALLVACTGSRTVDVRGKSPAQASEEMAAAACERSVECGEVHLSCESTGTGGTVCEGSIEPADYDECYAETQPAMEASLACAMPDDALAAMINVCFNDVLALPCPTQADVDAYVQDINDGTTDPGTPPPPGLPPSCAEVLPVLFGCM